jgi:hypothetical protein
LAGEDAFAFEGLTEFLRNGFGLVVHIAAAVGEAYVVEKNHAAGSNEVVLADEAELMPDGVPVVIAVEEDAVEGAADEGEGVEADGFVDGDAGVGGVFEGEVGVEAGIDDGVGEVGELEESVGGEAVAGADFAEAGPAVLAGEWDDDVLCELVDE